MPLLAVMELMEQGSLAQRMKVTSKPLDEATAASYVSQVLQALTHVHSLGIVHRDVKAANVLLSKHDCIKLCDFSISTRLHRGATKAPPALKPFAAEDSSTDIDVAGSPYWMAPEVLAKQKPHSCH